MNHIKTFMLLAAMTALFVGVGYLIGGATATAPTTRASDARAAQDFT